MDAFITWNDKYNTGHLIIDYQHKRLVRLINDLDDLSHLDNLENSFYNIIVSELENYTRYHFSTEEEIMRKRPYEGLQDHIALHQDFIEQLLAYKEKNQDPNDQRDKKIDREFCLYLKYWLMGHIAVEDQKIFALP